MLDNAARDTLFKSFGRAFFKRDVAILYETVTPDFVWLSHDDRGDVEKVTGREAVAAQLSGARSNVENVRFHDVVYHHAPDATFMTFRITAAEKGTGRAIEHHGVERYTFRDGRIATKDVYRKPAV